MIDVRVPQDVETIQGAIDIAEEGDTILISKGEWTETIVVDNLDDITIRAKGGALIMAPDGADAVLRITNSSGVTLHRVRIEGGTGHGTHATACDDMTIERCRVEDATATASDSTTRADS